MKGGGNFKQIRDILPGLELTDRLLAAEPSAPKKRKPPAAITPIPTRLIEAAIRDTAPEHPVSAHNLLSDAWLGHRKLL